MALALVQAIRVRDPLASERTHDAFRLRRRHHVIVGALQDQHRCREQVDEIDRAACAIDVLGLGPRPDERVLVARLELVRVIGGEGHQIGDPVEGRARREHIGERQSAHRRVPAGAATTDEEAFAVGVATLDQERGGVHAIVQVHDAPVAVQPLTVGPAVSRGTAVVHIDHAEPPGREELQTKVQRRGVRARRPAMADHDQRRTISLGSDGILIGRWVEERVRAKASVGRKLDRLRDRQVALLDRNAQALPQHLDRARGEVQPDHLIRFRCRPGREHDG